LSSLDLNDIVTFCHEWMSRYILSAINKVSVLMDGFFIILKVILKGMAIVYIDVVDWNYYKYIMRTSI